MWVIHKQRKYVCLVGRKRGDVIFFFDTLTLRRNFLCIFIILLRLLEVMTFSLLLHLSQAEIRYLPSDFYSYFMTWINFSLSLKWINSAIWYVMQLYMTCQISICALQDITKWNSSSISWLLQILHVLSSRFKILKHPFSICKGRMPNLISAISETLCGFVRNM